MASLEQQRAIAMAQARRAQEQAAQADQNADLWQPGTPFTPTEGGTNRADPMWWAGEIAGQAPGAINAFNEGFGEGIPVVGPAVTNAGEATGALIASMLMGRPYEDVLAENRQFREDRMEGHDIARGVGNVAGAVAPLGLAAATPVGGQMLGVTGTLPSRVMAGGATGAGIAAFDTAARGGDFDDTWKMALLGGGVGGAFPLAERSAQAIARMLMGKRGVSVAESAFDTMLQSERIAPQNLSQALDDIGPGALPVDLGRGMQYQGGAIAALPGRGQSIMSDALTARNAETNPRIQAQIRDILGDAPLPSALQADIRANQQALSPDYERAFANASAVDTSNLALNLDAMAVNLRGDAQRAAQRVRDMLNVTGTGQLDPNPYTLFQTRQAIDGMMDGVTDNNVRRVLAQARQEVDDLLGRAVPGIKDVDARFSELARQGEAVQTGQQLLDSGRTAMRPQELEQLMQQQGVIMGPTGVPFRLSQGARAEIDRLIGTTGNNLTALKTALKGDGSWNRDRLVTLFGSGRADALLDVLENEIRFNTSFNTVLNNSATAGRVGAMAERAPNEVNLSIRRLLMGIPEGVANAAARTRSQSVNAQIAELLTGRPSPELVDRLIAIRAGNRGTLPPASIAALLTNQGGAN